MSNKMPTHRISIDIDEQEHKYLKMCCAKLGMTIKEFVIGATIDRVDAWEDKWMLERWERDGTRAEIEIEKNEPNRTVYELKSDNGIYSLIETTYLELKESSLDVERNSEIAEWDKLISTDEGLDGI